MNKLKLIITEEAFSDLDSISNFIAKDNRIAAKNLIKNLFDCFDKLAEFPQIGTNKNKIKNKDVKIFIYKKNYLIAYIIDNANLVVLKVTNHYQDIFRLL